jgi:hypothetical protein
VKFSPETALNRPQYLNGLAEVFDRREWRVFFILCLFQLLCMAVVAHPEISVSDDDKTVTVGDAPDEDVIVFGKDVVIQKRAKSAFSMGGNIKVEGQVERDVMAVGGNVVQEEGAYVGGNIFAIGGAYKPVSQNPLREPGFETVSFGMFEDELRDFGRNPSLIFSPNLSLTFVAQRILVALLWFIISMAITTIAPGAVGRSVARLQLSALKVCALGATAFILIGAVLIGGVAFLPTYLSATVGLMGLLVLVLAYVFGRVSLQVSAGKLLQKYLLSESNRSETLATLFGVLLVTLLLSLPYIWLLALFAVFTVGVGLILTGRAVPRWKTP